MFSFPELVIRLDKIRENAKKVAGVCSERGIAVWGVTKGLSGNVEVAKAMLEGGCTGIADSRMKNIVEMKESGINGPFMLLRLPMLSELDLVARYVDITLISMKETIFLLEEACKKAKRKCEAIVMVDVGDLREGIWPDEAEDIGMAFRECEFLKFAGVGTNLGCLSGVIPTRENLSMLVETGKKIADVAGSSLKYVSGGGTSSLKLVEDGLMPSEVNQLRIGEAILLGTDVTRNREIPYLSNDAIEVRAEIIECRRKPTKPIGEIGADAFGNVPHFEDKGIRLRAIAAIGRQDIRLEGLTVLDSGLEIIGASSDHLTMDAEGAKHRLKVGDIVRFRPDYGAMLAASTSRYVRVRIV
ncbi:alanine racemase domain protein [Thermovirga lienii DSM 17291]|jgi:predicted amino acid racemase|uniref:Alanine racemase domain protein n=1 Tax=Thermovirga lienii (strain ATCC BAA-1197 / DSM 17291 / Cas60314) TaxID=580340 RepID=G7V9E1_THELD|nr:alanine/ornithine racemase family PLP-dependent enzyme [Thermovirga lienii]MDN5318636.1 ornithine racemase [Thermovirga sp.]AER66491.1 alanine racemase domain protein [Thermovirga lienii DSM 17291]KUK42370.1 MAG: Alanine racemase domain protein [Thermovirga lienii]MDN5367459.1 ornithine racemase [Thermovirga sp.]HCD72325.1 alanine/ornithine racemase family PLP-dependent enzyme [Thermovirga lienii]